MPKYGTFKYGEIGKYGHYDLGTNVRAAIGPYVRYRMRLREHDGTKGEWVTMVNERVELPPNIEKVRIRINEGEWLTNESCNIDGETFKVRVRSIGSEGQLSEWVYGDKANLKLI